MSSIFISRFENSGNPDDATQARGSRDLRAHSAFRPERRGAGPVRSDRVLQPGHNCWRIDTATRASVLVDAAEYFDHLARALPQARHSIIIVGWDFDGRIRLRPDDDASPALGPLLRQLVEANPQLHVHILVWSVATVHAPSEPLPLLIGTGWQDHPRISLRLDTKHPFYASHHQKVIALDDAVAFCGGMDLTIKRWDTPDHCETHPLRCRPDGECYGPVHDVQMVVEGDSARALGRLARERWLLATGELLEEPPAPLARPDLWPDRRPADFTGTSVAIARTMPSTRSRRSVDEIAHLTAEMLLAARRTIYIEAQYFCGKYLRTVFRTLLQRPEGPDIVVVAAGAEDGFVEQVAMGRNRERLIRRLRRLDRFGRLRVMYPAVPGSDAPCKVLVHSKVMIIDDRMLRIGSANLNNRSMGLDTECDLVIEAQGAAESRSIAAVRDRLMAEHLGASPEAVAEAVAAFGLAGAIDRLNRNERGLREFSGIADEGPVRNIFGSALLDPRKPLLPRWMR